jgi:hypothetical protein
MYIGVRTYLPFENRKSRWIQHALGTQAAALCILATETLSPQSELSATLFDPRRRPRVRASRSAALPITIAIPAVLLGRGLGVRRRLLGNRFPGSGFLSDCFLSDSQARFLRRPTFLQCRDNGGPTNGAQFAFWLGRSLGCGFLRS